MRRALFLLIALISTGCTTMQPVSRVDVMELDDLNRELRGRTIGIEFVDGTRERGRLEFVRMDSLAWRSDGLRQVVPLHHVDRLISDNRLRSVRDGVFIGAGIGAIIMLAILTSSGDSNRPLVPAFERMIAPYMIPGIGFYGGTLGVVLGRRRVYQLKDYAPWHSVERSESESSDN